MKICIISYKPKYFGGGSISTETLINALKKLGHEVVLIRHPSEINNPNIVLHQNIRYLYKTYKICKKKDIPLVATINSFISCCNGSHITNEDPKYGVSCEQCSLRGAFGCFLYDKRNYYISKVNQVFNTFLAVPKRFNQVLRLRTLNKVDKVVCISPTMRRLLTKAGVKENKIVVIPQPVDTIESQNEELFTDKVCLFVGGISWIKGAHLAAEAVSKLDDIRIVFVGGVKPEMKKQIYGFLGERAVFVDVVSKDEMFKYYDSAHVVLFPSIWYEGYARSFSEAMMYGKPVVTFDNGRGATDYLIHEITALVSEFNTDAYAEQIKRLFDDRDLYQRISMNTRNYANKVFLSEVVAKRYIGIFKEVLDEQ